MRHGFTRALMRIAGLTHSGRIAYALAALLVPPYKGARILARDHAKGYVAFSAKIQGHRIHLGRHSFIGDDVVLYQSDDSGDITLGERSSLNQACILETGAGGRILIGQGTHIQPRCQLSAYQGTLMIGDDVQIAPACAFYPYNHGFSATLPMKHQALTSKGGITIENGAWLGYGVIVLDGVHIGEGAVVGAGSVVTKDIPAYTVAAGSPARIVRSRETETSPSEQVEAL